MPSRPSSPSTTQGALEFRLPAIVKTIVIHFAVLAYMYFSKPFREACDPYSPHSVIHRYDAFRKDMNSVGLDSELRSPRPSRRVRSTMIRLCGVCAVANLGGLLVGFHLAVFSGILEMPSFSDSFKASDPSTKSLITSALIFGAIIGTIPAGPFVDKHGRRKALLLTAVLFSIATLCTIYSRTVAQLMVSRSMAGIGYAFANVVCPMYTAEIAPPAVRGMLVNLYQLLITIGIFMAQIANAGVWETGPWTYPLSLALIPAALMLGLVWLVIPESEVWLQSRLQTDVEGEKVDSPTLKEIMGDVSARRRLVIGAGISISQQLTGINAVIFFGPAIVSDVLSMKGSSGPFLAAAAVGAANVLATVGSMFFVDRFGRRQLLLAAGPPMVGSLTTIGAMRYGIIGTSGVTGLGALVTFIIAFAITYGPLTFVVCSEVFPVRYKGLGMGVCSLLLMSSCLFVGATFLPLLEVLKGGVYFVYATCVVLSSLFVWKFVPETKNLSLHEIDELLDGQG